MKKYYKKGDVFFYSVSSKEVISIAYMVVKYGIYMYSIHISTAKNNTINNDNHEEITEEEFKKVYKNALKQIINKL